MEEQLNKDTVLDYYAKQVELRGSRDARVKISLFVGAYWPEYSALLPPDHTSWSVEQLLDDTEVALGLRAGPPFEHHAEVRVMLEGWKSIIAHPVDGTTLQSRPTQLGELDLRPLSGYEVQQLRAHTKLSPERFGALLGVSRQRVYAWEGEGTQAAQPYLSALLRLYWPLRGEG